MTARLLKDSLSVIDLLLQGARVCQTHSGKVTISSKQTFRKADSCTSFTHDGVHGYAVVPYTLALGKQHG